jgi:SAM-dependent methyltransferase
VEGRAAERPLLLNLGCGRRACAGWVNVDRSLRGSVLRIAPLAKVLGERNPPGYLHHDLRRGIPCRDGAADAVYASHLLEHLPRAAAVGFLADAHRALRPGGVLRIVVPDLETAARDYVAAVGAARAAGGDAAALERLEWQTILLIDQMVRTRPGGETAAWLGARRDSPFVRDAGGIIREIADAAAPATGGWKRLARRLAARRSPARSGELHRWMYDEVSLANLLARAGFRDVRRVGPAESRIPGWAEYELDVSAAGEVHQPGSLYVEGVK